MKILVLTNAPAPYRMDFFAELGKKLELTVLIEQSAAEQTHRNPEWFTEYAHSFETIYLKGIKCGSKKLHPEVVKYLKKKEYDLILVMGYSLPTEILSVIYLHFKRIPFVLCFDGTVPKQTSAAKNMLKKFLISKASYFLSTGEATDEYIRGMTGRAENIYRVPFTTLHREDLPRVLPGAGVKKQYQQKLGLEGRKVILSVGQFIHRKGYDVLLKAAPKLTDGYEFYIVGDEPTEEYISLKQELGLQNVHFIGFKKKDELVDYYLAADWFILPTREDVWALVIPEAMSYGLPTITTDHCGAGVELIKPRFPECIVPIDDVNAIVNAIKMLDQDPQRQAEISTESFEMMKQYTMEDMIDRYYQIFSDITARGK